MNMPLTTGHVERENMVLDRIAADIEAVKAPTIDTAACDAAGFNEKAITEPEWFHRDKEHAKGVLRGALGREPSVKECECFVFGVLHSSRKWATDHTFAGNRSDSYPNVAGNRLDTLGHDTPLVKGGQGRNGLDVNGTAAVFFTALAAIVVLGMIAYFAFGGHK